MQNSYMTRQDSTQSNQKAAREDNQVKKIQSKYKIQKNKLVGRLSNLHFYDNDLQVHEGDYGSFNDFVNWDYDEQEQEQEVRKFKKKN